MTKTILMTSLLLLGGCAKMSYIVNQGIGQTSLEWNGRDNDEVLADKNVEESDKKKIRDIEKYKAFFYEYFGKEPTGIYDETTFLESPAVTYLVIASEAKEIKALEHDFPIVGTFPYLGFFDRDKAHEFQKKLKKDGYETYVRPVYAYSTLDQWIFDDNILSSFFEYNEIELAELIFHELFHTVFFVKSEVSVNENLAQYFSRELVFEYFKYSELQRESYIQRKAREKRLVQKVVDLTSELSKIYERLNDQGKTNHAQARKEFVEDRFRPELKLTCEELNLNRCWPLEKDWNNARFAAFLTYESGQNKIEKLKESKFPDLLSFYKYLNQKVSDYEKKEGRTFEDYIFEDYAEGE